tara:strand:+ start:171 stop:428 length:258 start_codon:yes stop_codon:yes gene_type:complete
MNWFSDMIKFFTTPEVDEVAKAKVLDKAIEEGTVTLKPLPKRVRARTIKGTYIADDKSTPNVNEAWVGGKAPKPKSKVVRIKKKK